MPCGCVQRSCLVCLHHIPLILSRLTGRSYHSPSEEAQRKQIWLNNRRLVLVHNIMADEGIKSYRLGMTYFADMVGTRKWLFVPTTGLNFNHLLR